MPQSSREFRPDLTREIEYLLGQIPRVDRETLQGLLIENQEVSDRVSEAEYELFDAYARGDMPSAWRRPFEERLLATPEGRRKLAVSRRMFDKAPQPKRSWWLVGAVAAGIALVAGWLPLSKSGGVTADARQVEIAQRVQVLQLRPVVRGEAARMRHYVAPETTQIEFAGIDGSAAELTTLQGKAVWKSSGNPPFRIPIEKLRAGDYLLTAAGPDGKPVNFYEFEIVR